MGALQQTAKTSDQERIDIEESLSKFFKKNYFKKPVNIIRIYHH